ncbi:MAG: alkaline phosphatase [Actinobacteria bacterium]|nr:alkaline phosphatase [Actinomycetota bacterium]
MRMFEIDSAHALGLGSRKVKNIILMISDGCGYNHIEATDYYEAGRKKAQAYEHFPVRLGMSTYEYELVDGAYKLLGYDPRRAWSEFEYVKENATDSASAATAMSTSFKTKNGAIGVDVTDRPLSHLAQRAEELGMATGVITSVEWSHATPAGFVAHNPSRNNYEQIASEMINNSATDVIMGCGHPWFDDNGRPKASPGYKYVGGQATWDALVAGTAGKAVDADHNGIMDDAWKLIQDRAEFQVLASGPTPKRVCGTAKAYTTLQQGRSGDGNAAPYIVPLTQSVPTLEEMTKGALNVLDNDRDGFFLMIEGGAVDWASHANQSGRMIEEEMDFNHAVDAVIDWVRRNSNWAETLLVVTGDHECGYLCGPGSAAAGRIQPVVNNGRGALPGMEWNSDEHTNALIPLYVKGWASIHFYRYANEFDPVRGLYIDNAELGKLLFGLLR